MFPTRRGSPVLAATPGSPSWRPDRRQEHRQRYSRWAEPRFIMLFRAVGNGAVCSYKTCFALSPELSLRPYPPPNSASYSWSVTTTGPVPISSTSSFNLCSSTFKTLLSFISQHAFFLRSPCWRHPRHFRPGSCGSPPVSFICLTIGLYAEDEQSLALMLSLFVTLPRTVASSLVALRRASSSCRSRSPSPRLRRLPRLR
jgi:hypothetical protein